MSRKLFDKGVPGKEESSDIEYTPPEKKLVDSELLNKLLEHYIKEIGSGKHLFWINDFEPEVQLLQSMIKDTTDNLNPQLLIDSLTITLKDESDYEDYSKTHYLTAVVQALYNLDYGSEFVINIRDWPEGEYYFGAFLKGTHERPLTLNLYGDLPGGCGTEAEYCNFIIFDTVDWCGYRARHSNFTFHDSARLCGEFAKHCTFYQMPFAEIKYYLAKDSNGNVRKRLKENDEWKVVPSPSWHEYILKED